MRRDSTLTSAAARRLGHGGSVSMSAAGVVAAAVPAAPRRHCIARLSHRETRQLSHSSLTNNKRLISNCQAIENARLLRAFGWQLSGTSIACLKGSA